MSEAMIMVIPTVFAAIANYGVMYFDWWPALKRPLSSRLFGANKTWRGLVSLTLLGVLGGALALILETVLLNSNHYTLHNFYWAGALQGLAWALGELPNSWLKRRANIPPGQAHVPGLKGRFFICLNQVDSPFACTLVAFMTFAMTVSQFVFLVLLGSLLHFYVNHLLFRLGIRKSPAY